MFHTDAVSMYCQKTNAQATYWNGSTHTYLGLLFLPYSSQIDLHNTTEYVNWKSIDTVQYNLSFLTTKS